MQITVHTVIIYVTLFVFDTAYISQWYS